MKISCKSIVFGAILAIACYTPFGAAVVFDSNIVHAQVPVLDQTSLQELVQILTQAGIINTNTLNLTTLYFNKNWPLEFWNEAVKNFMTNLLQTDILNFIKGTAGDCPSYLSIVGNITGQNLCPKFVTNWADFLTQGENYGYDQFLNEVNSAGLPANVTTALNPVLTNSQADQLKDQLGSNFQPTGSAVGDVISEYFSNDNIYMDYLLADNRNQELEQLCQEAQNSEGLSGLGFLGTKENVGSGGLTSNGQSGAGGSTNPCANLLITDPGSAIANQDYSAQDVNFKQIENAQDPTQILTSILNYFMGKLINQGFSGLLGLINTVGTAPTAPSFQTYSGSGTGTTGGTTNGTGSTGGTSVSSSTTISANPTSIDQGSSATITWSSPETSCFASGGVAGDGWPQQTVAGSGSITVTPFTTATYNIACGGQTSSVTVFVFSGGGGGG